MTSALTRRSVREISRRKARSALTILTIAVAVAGIWLFAIPGNIDASLKSRVANDAMHTARLAPNTAELTESQLAELRAMPNVSALDIRTLGGTDIRMGDRVQWAWLIGVEDFQDQRVNVVSVEEGALPSGTGGLVTDFENARTGRFLGRVGDTVQLRTQTGRWQDVTITGRGGTLRYSSTVADDAPILYLAGDDVRTVMGYPAPNSIDVIAIDPATATVRAMVTDIRAWLEEKLPGIAYWDVLEVWEEGSWPGSEDFDNFLVVFYVIAGVALLSALILIYTTMNTIVREQTREIGVMKAVGGTRGQIGAGYLRTALLIGGLGTALGIAIGIPLNNLLMTFMSAEFGGTSIGWRVSGPALLLSVTVGVGGTVLAAWPALRRAGRITVREAIEDHGMVAGFGLGPTDRLAARVGFISRRSQMGLRNASRRPGRTLATAVPIALAVGTMLGFGAVLITAVNEDLNSFDLEGGDITVWNEGRRGLDSNVKSLIESVPGVAFAHQMIYSTVEFEGEHNVWGLPAESTYAHDVIAGRWFTEDEAMAAAPVAVFGEALVELTGTRVGDTVTLETRRGPVTVEVVGIDGQLVNDGQGLFMPFQTVLDYEGWTTGNYWVRTVDPSPEMVNTAADGIHETLAQNGYRIGSNLRYIDRAANQSENRLIVTVVMTMGAPIVAIGMLGLVSAMASNILDRTREIGVLRSIGARRRDLRSIFRAEGVTIALLGWLLGIPTGFGLARFILWVLENEFHASFVFVFPLWPLAVALVVTLVVSLLVLRLPVRRVVRMQPGSALRYE